VEKGPVFVEPIEKAAVFSALSNLYSQDGDVAGWVTHLFPVSARTEALSVRLPSAHAFGTWRRKLASPVAEFVSLWIVREHFLLDREEVTWDVRKATYTFPDDVVMSRAHAKVYHRGEDFFLEDLESRNGTFLRPAARSRFRSDSDADWRTATAACLHQQCSRDRRSIFALAARFQCPAAFGVVAEPLRSHGGVHTTFTFALFHSRRYAATRCRTWSLISTCDGQPGDVIVISIATS